MCLKSSKSFRNSDLFWNKPDLKLQFFMSHIPQLHDLVPVMLNKDDIEGPNYMTWHFSKVQETKKKLSSVCIPFSFKAVPAVHMSGLEFYIDF